MNTAPSDFYLKNDTSSGISPVFPGTVPRKDDDVELLILRVLQENDYKAFQTLFRKMYSPLCQFCIKFVHVREIAEELVSDVFYNIWKNRERITVTSPKAYLFTSVRNKSFDYLRKVKRSVCVDLEAANHIPATVNSSYEVMIHDELHHRFERSVANLPKQCRLIFELSRDEGMKYKEIAVMLNISIKTVETQMGRALKNLRKSLPA
jgi:RNA polymerase sigma-70 factor (family 1)